MWTNFILTENGIAVVIFSENVVVAEQVITLLEVLSFCDWERASPPSIKITVLTFQVEKSTRKLLWVSSF